MKKILALLLLLPGMAFATCTWTSYGSAVKGVCTTGTESNSLGATDGIPVGTIKGFAVFANADTGQTLQNGTLQAYVYNANFGLWSRVSDLDLVLSTSTTLSQGWGGMSVNAYGGRIAWLPNSVTISGGSLTIWIQAG